MELLLKRWFAPVLTALAFGLVLLIIRAIAMNILRRWSGRTKTRTGDLVLNSLRWPSILWVAALGIYLGVEFSDLPDRYLAVIEKTIPIIILLSVTIATANLSGRMFSNYVQRTNLPLPTTGLAYGLLKGVIYIIGFLIILSVLGISITPLITALGVGGLAVALALQDTLANLFAGIHILMEQSIKIGDFVKLETGQEGYVDDISWRTTRIRMLPNNMVLIPNSKLSQSIVTNYYLPEKRMAVSISISVGYDSDPDRIERILVEEAKKGMGMIPGLLESPEPVARFAPGFGHSSLDFTLVCHVREFTDQYYAQHELRKRIFKRFKEEGIEIPYPQQTVRLKNEK